MLRSRNRTDQIRIIVPDPVSNEGLGSTDLTIGLLENKRTQVNEDWILSLLLFVLNFNIVKF